MKKIHLVFALFVLLAASCKIGGENYSRYYSYVNIDQTVVPDSASLGDTIDLYFRAGAPNGCWSGLQIYLYRYNDTIFVLEAIGLYESYEGICPEIYVTSDTIFRFVPDTARTYIFASHSATLNTKLDTLRIINP